MRPFPPRLIAVETEHYVFNHGDTNTAIRLFPRPIHSDDPRIIEARMANRSASWRGCRSAPLAPRRPFSTFVTPRSMTVARSLLHCHLSSRREQMSVSTAGRQMTPRIIRRTFVVLLPLPRFSTRRSFLFNPVVDLSSPFRILPSQPCYCFPVSSFRFLLLYFPQLVVYSSLMTFCRAPSSLLSSVEVRLASSTNPCEWIGELGASLCFSNNWFVKNWY